MVACDKDDADCNFHWDYPLPTEQLSKKYSKKLTEKQAEAWEFFVGASEVAVSVALEPVDWLLTYDDYQRNGFNPWMLAGLLPFIPGSAGRHADDIVETGYDSFRQLKKALGSPGEGMNWHHIVEQSQIKKSGFSPQQIHNADNVLAVDKATHSKISGFYSSIRPFTDGLKVRDWLSGQSFEAQYNFGIQVLKDFGVLP